MDYMEIYNATREVPKEAKKAIGGGRLKGKTDINPMWRIKVLTEQFGPCGIGWKYEITRQWLEQGYGGEVAAFCNINLYIKYHGEWSEAIPGTGGSALVASESKGLYTSDECYKMALTDAISVACKALGFGADVYWDSDRTKYDQTRAAVKEAPSPSPAPAPVEAPAENLFPGFDQDLEVALSDLRSAKSRKEVLEIDVRYRGVYGQYSRTPNQRYMDTLAEVCKKYPRTNQLSNNH